MTVSFLAVGTQPVAADELPEATPTSVVEASPAETDADVEEHRAEPESAETEPQEPNQRRGIHLYWKRGLNYGALRPVRLGGQETGLEGFLGLNGRIGLRLGVDTAGYLENGSLPDLGTEFNLRRAFIYTTGEFHLLLPILFRIDVGGIENSPYLSDTYVWLRDVPYLGTVKLGQFDAPMSLETLTGSTNQTFMEYASPVEAFSPGLKVGAQISDHSANERVTWAFGYFTDGQKVDVGDTSITVVRLTGRVTWLALQPQTSEDTLVHLGASASYVLSPTDRIRYSSRPESFLAPKLVETGNLDTSDAFPFGFEFAVKRGPLTLQAEYLASKVTAGSLGNAYFDGAYGSASWFLTGEQRSYDASAGKMGPLTPIHDLDPRNGRWGAWELAGRASWLDLTDGPVRGGDMVMLTAGINWYWNRYIRILFDTSFANLYDGPNDGRIVILQSRFQLVF